jgi:hypothetical protein
MLISDPRKSTVETGRFRIEKVAGKNFTRNILEGQSSPPYLGLESIANTIARCFVWESPVVRCAVEERYFFSAEKTVNGRSSIQQRSGCHNDFASAAATKAISLIEIGRPGSMSAIEIFRQLSVIASNCAFGPPKPSQL